MEHIACLHGDAKSNFGVSFPDFPGCITAGKSLDEARRKAPEALAFHIAGMLEDGKKSPSHRSSTIWPKIPPGKRPSRFLSRRTSPNQRPFESTSPPAKTKSCGSIASPAKRA